MCSESTHNRYTGYSTAQCNWHINIEEKWIPFPTLKRYTDSFCLVLSFNSFHSSLNPHYMQLENLPQRRFVVTYCYTIKQMQCTYHPTWNWEQEREDEERWGYRKTNQCLLYNFIKYPFLQTEISVWKLTRHHWVTTRPLCMITCACMHVNMFGLISLTVCTCATFDLIRGQNHRKHVLRVESFTRTCKWVEALWAFVRTRFSWKFLPLCGPPLPDVICY